MDPILQKNAQLSEQQQQLLLFDVVCLWLYLSPMMAKEFPSTVMEQHQQLFMKGNPGCIDQRNLSEPVMF